MEITLKLELVQNTQVVGTLPCVDEWILTAGQFTTRRRFVVDRRKNYELQAHEALIHMVIELPLKDLPFA